MKGIICNIALILIILVNQYFYYTNMVNTLLLIIAWFSIILYAISIPLLWDRTQLDKDKAFIKKLLSRPVWWSAIFILEDLVMVWYLIFTYHDKFALVYIILALCVRVMFVRYKQHLKTLMGYNS